MITGKTESGFSYTLEEAALDDMELLEWLIEIDNGNPKHLADMIASILGSEQKKSLYEHCRKDGRVSVKMVMQEIGEIFNTGGKQIKNSLPLLT